jgi:hypothetical protein
MPSRTFTFHMHHGFIRFLCIAGCVHSPLLQIFMRSRGSSTCLHGCTTPRRSSQRYLRPHAVAENLIFGCSYSTLRDQHLILKISGLLEVLHYNIPRAFYRTDSVGICRDVDMMVMLQNATSLSPRLAHDKYS